MTTDFAAALVEHRPALLRHCYRMMGSFAEADDVVQDALERAWKARSQYKGESSIRRWLYTIATNACLTALARRRHRALPQLETQPAGAEYAIGEQDHDRWITPASDGQLFPDPAQAAEARETVALAFIALLQRLAPRQRAVLLLKDVVGWSADEIAEALELTVPAVSSALHRGRQAIARAEPPADEPAPATLHAFLRAWETRDLEALVALLRKDVLLAMPPHAFWFRGIDDVTRFLRTPGFQAFWSSVVRLPMLRANGLPALGFLRRLGDGSVVPHSVMVVRFVGEQAAEMTTFIGAHAFAGFEI